MEIIINSKQLNITEEQMKELYKKNLIVCDDYTLTVATIPEWAINEVENLLGIIIDGTETEDYTKVKSKRDVAYYNHYHYPRLYESICDFNGVSYESGYKRKVTIKEGVVIGFNNERVLITEVIKDIGFYYKNETDEVKFCNTMFETLNFVPVYE